MGLISILIGGLVYSSDQSANNGVSNKGKENTGRVGGDDP
jgi:hypothetical protein